MSARQQFFQIFYILHASATHCFYFIGQSCHELLMRVNNRCDEFTLRMYSHIRFHITSYDFKLVYRLFHSSSIKISLIRMKNWGCHWNFIVVFSDRFPNGKRRITKVRLRYLVFHTYVIRPLHEHSCNLNIFVRSTQS